MRISNAEVSALLEQVEHLQIRTLRGNPPLFNVIKKLVALEQRMIDGDVEPVLGPVYDTFKMYVANDRIIDAIKMTRLVLGCGLKEAKDYVEAGHWFPDSFPAYVLIKTPQRMTVDSLEMKLTGYGFNTDVKGIK